MEGGDRILLPPPHTRVEVLCCCLAGGRQFRQGLSWWLPEKFSVVDPHDEAPPILISLSTNEHWTAAHPRWCPCIILKPILAFLNIDLFFVEGNLSFFFQFKRIATDYTICEVKLLQLLLWNELEVLVAWDCFLESQQGIVECDLILLWNQLFQLGVIYLFEVCLNPDWVLAVLYRNLEQYVLHILYLFLHNLPAIVAGCQHMPGGDQKASAWGINWAFDAQSSTAVVRELVLLRWNDSTL